MRKVGGVVDCKAESNHGLWTIKSVTLHHSVLISEYHHFQITFSEVKTFLYMPSHAVRCSLCVYPLTKV